MIMQLSLFGGIVQRHLRVALSACAFVVVLLAVMVSPVQAQTATPQDKLPYLDPTLPVEKRVDDLISRMTLEEKVSQMRDHAVAIPRLKVAKYDWWNEGLHGVAF